LLLLIGGAGAARATAVDQATACTSASVVVSVGWDRERAEKVSGVVTRLRYPASLTVPSDPSDRSAKARVELLTGTSGGLFDALDKPGDTGELLNIGLITAGIGAGPFARIRFDCRPGAAVPAASDFGCVADVADQAGTVPATCSVTVAAN